jgi:phospholipid/cholesterol/gamma-HCH transport system ATP-binding protein
VVTHDIATSKRVADFIGMLYRRNLVKFGPAKEMFESDIPVVQQFLAGAVEGPIGMSEEKDSTKTADAMKSASELAATKAEEARSSRGMTAAETEEMERDAGAPEDGAPAPAETGARKKQV